MTTLKTVLLASSFATLSMLAAACGDDTGGGGAGGEGGESPSTSSTTTGGGGSICEQAADFSVSKSSELGCTAVERSSFVSECQTQLADAGDCADEYVDFFECMLALPGSAWSCDPEDNDLVAADGSCANIAQTLVTCLQG